MTFSLKPFAVNRYHVSMLKLIKTRDVPSWQEELSNMISSPAELLAQLNLNPGVTLASSAIETFPLRVARPFVARMETGNPEDPLLLQVLPQVQEDLDVSGYTTDPLQEAVSNPQPGILHKYQGRLLLMPTSVCPIHCRYCFRRHFPYSENTPSRGQWDTSLEYLRAQPSIREVILSGGDPLSIPDRQIDWLLNQLDSITHLETIRIHSRFPVMIPQRITEALCEILRSNRFNIVFVLHSNHARELDDSVGQALSRLRQAGATLLNQSVLLKNINDSPDTLIELSKKLFSMQVLPYYLHMLDQVKGAAHFDVDTIVATQLIASMQQQLPGYLVPKLVREEAHHSSKSPVFL